MTARATPRAETKIKAIGRNEGQFTTFWLKADGGRVVAVLDTGCLIALSYE